MEPIPRSDMSAGSDAAEFTDFELGFCNGWAEKAAIEGRLAHEVDRAWSGDLSIRSDIILDLTKDGQMSTAMAMTLVYWMGSRCPIAVRKFQAQFKGDGDAPEALQGRPSAEFLAFARRSVIGAVSVGEWMSGRPWVRCLERAVMTQHCAIEAMSGILRHDKNHETKPGDTVDGRQNSDRRSCASVAPAV